MEFQHFYKYLPVYWITSSFALISVKHIYRKSVLIKLVLRWQHWFKFSQQNERGFVLIDLPICVQNIQQNVAIKTVFCEINIIFSNLILIIKLY